MPRTINDIVPPSRRRTMNNEQPAEQPSYDSSASLISNTTPIRPDTYPTTDSPPASMPPTPPRIKIRTGRSFPYGAALIALAAIIIAAGVLYAFAGAKVQITPTSQTVSISGDFTATNGSGSLPFTIVTATKVATSVVPAESTLTANDSAQGSIVISNAQTIPQTLINNTRFSTPAGLIFRIHAPVTIPAASASGPGTLTVTVFADQPGITYNVGPTTFTVPGLKGGSSYTLVTAMSSAAMVGGFTGTRAAVSQGTDTTQDAALQTKLATSLQTELSTKVPAGDVILPGSSFISYQVQPDSATTTTSVSISEQGTVNAIVFPETALAEAIAYKTIGTYSGEPVSLANVSGLSLTATTPPTDFTNLSSFAFTLSGSGTVIWTVDPSRIAGAVAGKTRDSAESILQGFPEVNQAVLTLRPFWASTFPSDPSNIKVIISTPTAK